MEDLLVDIVACDPPEEIRAMYGVARDWHVYRISPLRNDLYDMLIDVIGDENFAFVSSATNRIGGDLYTSATIYISPQGAANIKAMDDFQ